MEQEVRNKEAGSMEEQKEQKGQTEQNNQTEQKGRKEQKEQKEQDNQREQKESDTQEAEAIEERMSYKDAEIDKGILKAVEAMGFETMSPIQEKAIPVLLKGLDIIGQAQTGTGKTAAFGIPMIQNVDPELKKLQGIVLCPTRELAMQAAEEIRKLAKYMHGVKVLAIYGGQDISKQIRALSQGVQIIVGTPGRVMDHMRRHTIKTGAVKMIVLDEADEMLNMGFREDIETILKDMPVEHQMALFSATMPQPILDITHTYQKDAEYIRVTPKEITVSAIKQAYYRVAKKDKMAALCRLIDYYQPVRSLIFCNTKRMVDEMAEVLKGRGYQAEGLHGDLSQHQRDAVMNLFRNGRCEILIATDVAARGIDVSGVDAVFNFDVPDDIEYYVHRIGRTGRAGRQGRSFTLVSGREIYKIRDIEKLCHTQIRERKLPTSKDIIRAKSGKVFAEAMDIMEQKDLSAAKAAIENAIEENDFTVLDLAAAFMQMKMGDEPEEIKEEAALFERGRSRGRRDDRNGRDGRGRRDDRSGRDGRGGSEGRNGRYGRGGSDSRGGNNGRGGSDSRGGRYGRSEEAAGKSRWKSDMGKERGSFVKDKPARDKSVREKDKGFFGREKY